MNGHPHQMEELASAILRGAHELKGIEQKIRSLEVRLEALVESRKLSRDEIKSLQDVDVIFQSVLAIRSYLEKLGEDSEISIPRRINAAVDAVKIGSIRNSLKGVEVEERGENLPELF